MRKGISVIIIYHNRPENLRNTLSGLANGSVTPDEIILIEMDIEKSNIDFLNLNYKHYLLNCNNSNQLPLASARNKGAELSTYDNLVFLDVDCIPSKNFIMNVKKEAPFGNQLFMGTPKYMLKPKVENLENLDKNSIFHPGRPEIRNTTLSNDYGLFWSLCFFISKQQFNKIEGFDEQYKGYGAEDTDFAFKLKKSNTDFYLTPFVVYHQQHPFYRPPLNHFNAIVKNSNLFVKKWNIWPMEKHLKKFKLLNLIIWNSIDLTPIKIVRTPNIEELKKALVINEPFS